MKTTKKIITVVLPVAMLFLAFQVGVAKKSPTSIKSLSLKEHVQSSIADFTILADTMWFPVTINGLDDEDPEAQEVTDQPTSQTPSGDCAPENQGEVCSVGLDLSGITDQEKYNELLDRIDNSSQPNPTIQEFLDIGATYLDDAHELTSN